MNADDIIFMIKMKRSTSRQHDFLVKHYSQIKNIDFIDNVVEVITEKPLHDIFGIKSYKTPDLIYITELEEIYVGEVKGRDTFNNRMKAKRQVMKYYDILKRNEYETTPFIIVGSYIEVSSDTI